MRKYEIKDCLRNQHMQRWDNLQMWLRDRMEQGDTDEDLKHDPMFDLKAMQLNTIIRCGEALGVDIERVEVNTVTVNMARESYERYLTIR